MAGSSFSFCCAEPNLLIMPAHILWIVSIACMYVCMYVYMYICIYVCMYLCMNVSKYVCMYV